MEMQHIVKEMENYWRQKECNMDKDSSIICNYQTILGR